MSSYPCYIVGGTLSTGETCSFELNDTQDVLGIAEAVKDAVYNTIAAFPGMASTTAFHLVVTSTDATPTP